MSINIDECNPTEELIELLADTMRDSDKRYIVASTGLDAHNGLKTSFAKSSYARIGCVNGRPAIGLCVVPMDSSIVETNRGASLWIVATDDILKSPFCLVKKSVYYIGELIRRYGFLYAVVNTEDKAAIRFVKFFGFKEIGAKYSIGNITVITYKL